MDEVKAEAQPKQRTFHWEPKCFTRDEQAIYTGHLVIKAMTGEERTDMLTEDGVFDAQKEQAGKKTGDQTSWLMSIYKKRKNLILGCEVVRVSDNVTITDLNELMYEESLWTIPLEFAASMVNGFNLGNGSRPGSGPS